MAAFAADAILVGDPGRALMLAQELLERPKMCNHARGLWGYTGTTPGGQRLTVQSTGMGAPSATAVLADLAELGVRRAVRVGSCTALDARLPVGRLLLVREARAWSGGGEGAVALPDPRLTAHLRDALADHQEAGLASFDSLRPTADAGSAGAPAADMQTAALLGAAAELGVAAAALSVVAVAFDGSPAEDEPLQEASKRAGAAALAALSTNSNPVVEG